MAQDEVKSGKSRFLSKSKWGKVLREREDHEKTRAVQHTDSFKLNEDVVDFLKPSTEAAGTRPLDSQPKIDIAIAQRWPDANQVRKASLATSSSAAAREQFSSPNGYTKPKRREGLVVGFVKTMPEIIGEGGDESEEPPREIGRQRAMMARSVSDRRPNAIEGGLHSIDTQGPRQARVPNGNEDSFRPQPLRRVQTSHNEFSPSIQRKQITSPVEEQLLSRPTLDRTPTGLGSQDEHYSRYDRDYDDYRDPQIDTRFASNPESTPNSSAGIAASSMLKAEATSGVWDSSGSRKRGMSSGEGMALRRASAMIIPDEDQEDEDGRRQSLSLGIQPSQEHYDALSRPDAPQIMAEQPEPPSPRSAQSPPAASPFADPKYLGRHSQAATSESQQPQSQQSARQQRQAYQPSYMRAVQPQLEPQRKPIRPPVPQVQAPRKSDESGNSDFQDDRPSYMRAQQPPSQQQQTRPPPPQISRPEPVPGPPQTTRPARRDNQPSHMKTAQPPNEEFVAARPTAASSQHINVSQNPQQNRDPSPFRQRIFDQDARLGDPNAIYNKPNGSSSSLNHFPPSPKFVHSRSSSRDGGSPRDQPHSAYGAQPPPSPRFQMQDQSPQGDSRRSSALSSPGSNPYARSSPNEYFATSKASQGLSAKSPATSVQLQESSSRPGSSSSDRSFSGHSKYFSAPRPPQVQVQVPKSQTGSLPQEQTSRAPSSDPAGYRRWPSDNSVAPRVTQSQSQPTRSTAMNLRQEDAQRPGSSGFSSAVQRPAISPQPTSEGNPAADAAFADFAARVAHMKGVFKLTAEKERSNDPCSPEAWLRTGLWWYLRGKAGLEVLLQSRPRSSDGQPRELLAQPHVDLAKTWWILSDPLEPYDSYENMSPQGGVSDGGNSETMMRQQISMLKGHLKTLSLSMGRSQILPPPQSLILGQDTRIWLDYPHFTADVTAVLGGIAGRSLIVDQSKQSLLPLEALPLGDSRDSFCYGRFPVEISVNTDDADTDRVVLSCIMSMLRSRRGFLSTVVIASQNDLVNLQVNSQRSNEKGLTWHDVSWKASSMSMSIRLPRGFDLTVRLQEKDFRNLWNLVEYSRKVEHSLRTGQDEKLVHEVRLAELQYADSSGSNAFPSDKLRGCMALVFERSVNYTDGGGQRRLHRGYRMLLVTDTNHKSLSSVSHEVCRHEPLYFEFITDAAAGGMAAMVIRVREEAKQCRILLVFPDMASRQNLYDVLNGLTVGPDETIVGKMSLIGVNIEPAAQVEGFSEHGHPALRALQWQKLGVTNALPEDPNVHIPKTVESECLRILARHANGCITDRLNLAKGELMIRLPCANIPALQILRNAQEDIGMSIDTRNSQPNVADGITELMHLAQQQSTIRTFTFASNNDLHSFQAAITGQIVRYDGLASTFGISRRMMVVPIYKKWEASQVRLQIIYHGTVVKVLAFMEDFSHADAMCFQVKSTDVFETVKGNGKDKKWAVKMVDAKFSLPQGEKGDVDLEERVRRRFVNLEGLDYAEEHDDITVGFDTEEDRDKFAGALPATATRGRGLTLKRRI